MYTEKGNKTGSVGNSTRSQTFPHQGQSAGKSQNSLTFTLLHSDIRFSASNHYNNNIGQRQGSSAVTCDPTCHPPFLLIQYNTSIKISVAIGIYICINGPRSTCTARGGCYTINMTDYCRTVTARDTTFPSYSFICIFEYKALHQVNKPALMFPSGPTQLLGESSSSARTQRQSSSQHCTTPPTYNLLTRTTRNCQGVGLDVETTTAWLSLQVRRL